MVPYMGPFMSSIQPEVQPSFYPHPLADTPEKWPCSYPNPHPSCKDSSAGSSVVAPNSSTLASWLRRLAVKVLRGPSEPYDPSMLKKTALITFSDQSPHSGPSIGHFQRGFQGHEEARLRRLSSNFIDSQRVPTTVSSAHLVPAGRPRILRGSPRGAPGTRQ